MSPVLRILANSFLQTLYQLELQTQEIPQATGHVQIRSQSFKSSLKKPWVRVVVIFGFVIALSFIAAWTGCIIASLHSKRRSIRRSNRSTTGKQTTQIRPPANAVVSSSDNSAEDDLEMLAQLDTIIADRTMANEAFKGRELNALRKEIREKAKRQARGGLRTSQGVNLPVNVRQLRGKMRSILRSMTRSDAAQDLTVAYPTLATVLATPNEDKTSQKEQKEHTVTCKNPNAHESMDEHVIDRSSPRPKNPDGEVDNGQQATDISNQA